MTRMNTDITKDNQDSKDPDGFGKNLNFLCFLLFKSGVCRAGNSAFLCVLRDSALKREPKFSAEGWKIEDEDEEIRNQTRLAVFAFKPANHIFDL